VDFFDIEVSSGLNWKWIMTNRSTTSVVDFLRDSLANGALAVADLEAMSRAAGLLSQRQQIQHAKAFKKAKKSLGIRSVRDGFGSGGRWAWLLPIRPAPLKTGPTSSEDATASEEARRDVVGGILKRIPTAPQGRGIPLHWLTRDEAQELRLAVPVINLGGPVPPSPSHNWLAIVGPRETNLSRGLHFLPCQARSVVWNLFLGEYIIGLVMGSRHASYRANPGRPTLLLPALRSPLFGDAFAPVEER